MFPLLRRSHCLHRHGLVPVFCFFFLGVFPSFVSSLPANLAGFLRFRDMVWPSSIFFLVVTLVNLTGVFHTNLNYIVKS